MRSVVQGFVAEVLGARPEFRRGCRILEIGSFNINGTVRDHFHDCDYVGCDWRAGPGVDVVALAHDLDFPDGHFDVALTTESLEHDAFWQRTIRAMHRLLRPGGLFVLTVASFNFPRHEIDCATEPGYYHNLMPDEVLPVLSDLGLEQVAYREQDDGLFYAGLKTK